MLVAGAREDYLLILAVVARNSNHHTAWITVGAIQMLNGIILLHGPSPSNAAQISPWQEMA